ncbi:MAG: ATP-binding cassette domain-containing protein [Sphingomonadaceae bacterium]|nr:ATP-binding cassette domain-containing protein [Sphingomonadaceae bacterium]
MSLGAMWEPLLRGLTAADARRLVAPLVAQTLLLQLLGVAAPVFSLVAFDVLVPAGAQATLAAAAALLVLALVAEAQLRRTRAQRIEYAAAVVDLRGLRAAAGAGAGEWPGAPLTGGLREGIGGGSTEPAMAPAEFGGPRGGSAGARVRDGSAPAPAEATARHHTDALADAAPRTGAGYALAGATRSPVAPTGEPLATVAARSGRGAPADGAPSVSPVPALHPGNRTRLRRADHGLDTAARLTLLTDLPFTAVHLALAVALAGGAVLAALAAAALALALAAAAGRGEPGRRARPAPPAAHDWHHPCHIAAASAAGALPWLLVRARRAAAWRIVAAAQARRGAAVPAAIAAFGQSLSYAALVSLGAAEAMAGGAGIGAITAAALLSARALALLGPLCALTHAAARERRARRNAARAAASGAERPIERPSAGIGAAQAASPLPPAVASRSGTAVVTLIRASVHHAGAPRPALDGVSLEIAFGDRVGVIGASGSGKSTLLAVLASARERSSGRAIGAPRADDAAPVIGAAIGPPVVFPASLADNIALGRRRATPARVAEALTLTGLDCFSAAAGLGPDQPLAPDAAPLPGAAAGLIAFARALAVDPDVLLLDDPAAGLDAGGETALALRLAAWLDAPALTARPRTLVLATNRPGLLRLTKRTIVLRDGRIVADGPAAGPRTLRPSVPAIARKAA